MECIQILSYILKYIRVFWEKCADSYIITHPDRRAYAYSAAHDTHISTVSLPYALGSCTRGDLNSMIIHNYHFSAELVTLCDKVSIFYQDHTYCLSGFG